jgi:transcriptional regulator with XRE-family HTH domain
MRARRLNLGLHQKDVAIILGVTTDTICYWENNRVRPSSRLLSKLVDFLGGNFNCGVPS